MCGISKAYTGLAPQENMWAGHTVSRLCSECWLTVDSLRCLCVYGEEEWREMKLPALVFPEKSLNDPCPPNPCSEISKQIFVPYTPGVFQNLLRCYDSVGLFVALSL